MLYCLKYHGCTSLCNGDETHSKSDWLVSRILLVNATLMFNKVNNESTWCIRLMSWL